VPTYDPVEVSMETRNTNEGNDTTTHAGIAEARIAQPVDPMIMVDRE